MAHIMFDLETFGTKPGSVLRSIGAAVFNPETGQVGAKFYANIDRASCEAVGLKVDKGTETWWAKQSVESQKALLTNCQPLAKVASDFHAFFKASNGVQIWCQGANFDSVLWEAAIDKVWPSKSFLPWKYWAVRDTRTVYELAGFDPNSIPRSGVYHNALDDSLHQIQCVSAAVRLLRAEQYA
ncbi:MAG: 3'-5' exoribonuclease [Delftia acidovorans]|nr:MAG: 3'-5' exoribonuclease [Delftia acidovorans]